MPLMNALFNPRTNLGENDGILIFIRSWFTWFEYREVLNCVSWVGDKPGVNEFWKRGRGEVKQ